MDLESLTASWTARLAAEGAVRDAAVADARARVDRAAALLRRDWGARRVLLFGSLAHGTWAPETSDVDLAVEGLAAEFLLPALGAVLDIIRWPVDLVRLEDAKPALRAAIAATAEEVP